MLNIMRTRIQRIKKIKMSDLKLQLSIYAKLCKYNNRILMSRSYICNEYKIKINKNNNQQCVSVKKIINTTKETEFLMGTIEQKQLNDNEIKEGEKAIEGYEEY